MINTHIHFQWQAKSVPLFRKGVSLHSHTLHSRESLDFIGRATRNTPWLSGAIRKQQAKYRTLKGRELDLTRVVDSAALGAPSLGPGKRTDREGARKGSAGIALRS
jgi:hypothetical protein